MRQIAGYIRTYWHENRNPKLFASVGAFLVLSFAVNYSFNFETSIIRQLPTPFDQFLFYCLFYGAPFTLTIFLQTHFTSRKTLFRDKQFIALVAFCIVLLAAYVSLHNLPSFLVRTTPELLNFLPKALHLYTARYAGNFFPGFIVLLPIAVYWYFKDRTESNVYGFSSSTINLKTYFVILLLLVPIVFAASFLSDFQSAYPRFKFGLPQNVGGSERSALIGIFEVCYGVDFLFVELFFRGFMVMAFARYLGSGAVLPMVVVYAFIHFQKPLGEAVGSIFGGLMLGIISERTKSIYGGIILHLGIAYAMEIAGAVQVP